MIQKLTLVTSNKNKLREVQEILGINIESANLEIDEVQTLDPQGLARKKARAAYQKLQKPLIIEDTALFFDAWQDLPGVYINAFIKTVGCEGLVKMLQPFNNRHAYAQTTVALYLDNNSCHTFIGKIQGTIANKPQGNRGFGWDPIFIPEGHRQTFAQMSSKEKNQISMRKVALTKLKDFLSEDK